MRTAIKVMDFNKLRIDGGTQLRHAIDENLVDEYADLLVDGVKMPPPVAYYDGANLWLADGFHRYHAHKAAGKAGGAVEIREGTLDDALLHAALCNETHGRRRTNLDKVKTVQMFLEHERFGQWSDREIATKAGVSHTLVSDLRNPKRANEKNAAKRAERSGEKATPRDKPTSSKGVTISDPESEVAAAATNSQVIHNPPNDADQGGSDRVTILSEEVDRLTHRLAVAAAEGYTEEEKAALSTGMQELQRAYAALQAERDSIAAQRDAYMRESAEVKKECLRLRKKLDQALAKK